MQRNELQHYGVLGMKLGIRRGRKQISKAETKEQYDKGVSTLTKHRGKASNKISKLEKKRPGLQEEYDRAIIKTDAKISKLEQKQAKYARRANRIFTTDRNYING